MKRLVGARTIPVDFHIKVMGWVWTFFYLGSRVDADRTVWEQRVSLLLIGFTSPRVH